MKNTTQQFDVIVVGGGHAGTEAALVAARMGSKTLLLTHNIETLGQMSCNPAIGGIGKTQLVKEIDALGGIMAYAADLSGIHFRTLNSRKGPAVRATRAQADRVLYKAVIRQALENQPNLWLFQQAVIDLIEQHNRVKGVVTQTGFCLYAPVVILTVGTFLSGKIHIGMKNYSGGRTGDPPAIALSERLRAMPFRVERLKTGTPPRIDGRTIDYSQLEEQTGDQPIPVMSYLGKINKHPNQVSCFITHTNKKTHDIIRSGLKTSPLFSGIIQCIGPRYCPSIEDKVVRFQDRFSHQIFLEPEGLNTHEVYPSGVSTSLDFDIQIDFIHSIKGLEKCHITRPGYAIEYDYFDPRDLMPSLETKYLCGLYFAGQINGTTGYEEAAAQGLIAGINAALQIQEREPWTPGRDEAYIGVLIDDLITQGTKEPYRMFTSRSEYRLLLRQDNADLRLTKKGRELGCVGDVRWESFIRKKEMIEREQQRLKKYWIRPNTVIAQAIETRFQQTLEREYSLLDLLSRPEITYSKLMDIESLGPEVKDVAVAEQIEIQAKYEGYLVHQRREISRQKKYESVQIPKTMDYKEINGLSNEVRQKLLEINPATVGQASRIPGVTPAAISLLLVHLKKERFCERLTLFSAQRFFPGLKGIREKLKKNIEVLHINISKEVQQTMLDFLIFLQQWNRAYNLTGIVDLETMITHHLLDSLSILPYLKGQTILDIGSGAGFPGLPLALACPDKYFTLLDSKSKKVAFLLQVVTRFKLTNVSMIESRVEIYKPEACFEAITARAFGPIKLIMDQSQHLLCPRGRWFIMKGAYPTEELGAINPFINVHRLLVPALRAERHLVEIENNCNCDRQPKKGIVNKTTSARSTSQLH